MTSSHTSRCAVRAARAWRDVAWPVLTGVTGAVGFLGFWQLTGPVPLAPIVLGLWLFFGVMLYGVASESGMRVGTAVRIGLWSSVATVALVGLLELLPLVGWISALVIAITSPPVTDWVTPRTRRVRALVRRRGAASRVDPEQAAVDRMFEEIVADLNEDAA